MAQVTIILIIWIVSQLKQVKASETLLTSTSGSVADQTEIEKLEEQASILREVLLLLST